jgi:hypothetical protein
MEPNGHSNVLMPAGSVKNMTTKIQRMNRNVACIALVSAMGFAAQAQEAPSDTSLDVTIRLLPQNAVGPEEITRRIQLPPAATVAAPPEEPTEGAPPGAENGQGRGLDTATEARERGRELGQETAERARENRESAGRPDNPGRPDTPAPPDAPRGPPETPPGRP